MGRKKKLERFAENRTFPHFFEPTYDELLKGFPLKGRWQESFFGNADPLVLELGCGKGEYTVGLARNNPKCSYIGIDRKGARMWRGAKTSLVEGLKNVAFVRTRIELIEYLFAPGEVDEIWITFPDPQPRERNERKRLTSPRFLERYRKILRKGGLIHLKTDSTLLYEYTSELIGNLGYNVHFSTDDLYQSGFSGPARDIQTFYESGFLENGDRIKYLQFSFE